MRVDIHLQSHFWSISPSVTIKLDNKHFGTFDNFVHNQKTNISFNVELDNGDHELVIERWRKSTDDTVIKDSKIIKDSTVDILDVIIDGISIDPLLDHAYFFPKYTESWVTRQKQLGEDPPASYKYCRTLHHNGQWKLNFATPVHIWFFQNSNIQI